MTPKLQILMPGRKATLLVGLETSGGRPDWVEKESNITSGKCIPPRDTDHAQYPVQNRCSVLLRWNGNYYLDRYTHFTDEEPKLGSSEESLQSALLITRSSGTGSECLGCPALPQSTSSQVPGSDAWAMLSAPLPSSTANHTMDYF